MGKMAASQSSLKCHRLCPLPHALQTRRNNLLETPCRKRFVTALPGQRKWRNALPTRRKSSDSHYRVLQERLSVLFLLFCFFFFFFFPHRLLFFIYVYLLLWSRIVYRVECTYVWRKTIRWVWKEYRKRLNLNWLRVLQNVFFFIKYIRYAGQTSKVWLIYNNWNHLIDRYSSVVREFISFRKRQLDYAYAKSSDNERLTYSET